jgi:hypothetical protein
MPKAVLYFPLLIVLWSCSGSDLTPLPPEKLNTTYAKVTIDWRGDMLGASTDFYIKRFEIDGKLAFCGARDGEETATYREMVATWFERAYFEIRNVRAIELGFLSRYVPRIDASTAMANCVKTDKPAFPYLGVPMTLKGDAVEVK